MLQALNITKSFYTQNVLNDVSLQLENGITALLGENGAGKTTLLRILCGFMSADAGSISVDNINAATNRTQYLEHIGYVQEISSLYDYLNVYEFLLLCADLRRISPTEAIANIRKYAQLFSLHDVMQQKCHTLSKGFKKRVELAAALLGNPDVLLLDEPTEGLDPNQKQIIRNVIKDYAAQHAVLISTHTLEDVEILADNILLLHQGKILNGGSLEQFKQSFGKDLSASFRKVTQG